MPANQRIAHALGTQDAAPGDEGDDGIEQAS
jgi:hypothetical protein